MFLILVHVVNDLQCKNTGNAEGNCDFHDMEFTKNVLKIAKRCNFNVLAKVAQTLPSFWVEVAMKVSLIYDLSRHEFHVAHQN